MNNYIGFVPLRGGSKSIPLKNIKLLNGYPLCYYVLYALQHSVCSQVVVATDSAEIVQTIKEFNFSKVIIYNRKPENALDTSSSESVILEYLNNNSNININTDWLVFAQATSVFTTYNDINKAIKLLDNSKYNSILSATLSKRFFWNKAGEAINYNYLNRPRRQDFEGCFQENGAFYINSIKNILNTQNRLYGNIGVYEMPDYSALEIDEEVDWIIAEELIKHYNPLKEKR